MKKEHALYMTKATIFLILMLSSSLFAEDVFVDVRCFSSPSKNISLEFRVYEDSEIGWVGGQVRYKQSSTFIPLVYEKTETLREIPDRPWEFKHTWLEFVNGSINGKYEVVSQGAIIYGFTYINKESGKVIDLSEATYPDEKGVCTWEPA